MFDRRTKNVTIFKDSMEMMSENERLQQAIKESVEKQTLYLEAENVEIPESNASKCRTLVSTGRSFETASRYARNGKRYVCLTLHLRRILAAVWYMEAQHRRSLYAGAVHCIHALILIKCGRSFTLHTEEPEIPCIMMTACIHRE